ncbi:PORR domain-containing protein [Cephalotus follicularis]|uniref:PORR domain-containing protein n=1 Tax=Cephalotus follicularis TaxID=3775 RepID=A0A1Q3D1X5_CEPFO|nr:PORR domain-containing protein [Cephalotus follicularis]
MSFCSCRLHQLHQNRSFSFINARIKLVRDPYLDKAVQIEKNLKQILSLKNQILSSSSSTPKSIPLSSLSILKPHLQIPTTASKFFQNYPSLFTLFQPSPSLPLHIKLTPRFLSLHKQESLIHNSPLHRHHTVQRLSKLLMLTGSSSLPLHVIDRFKFDLGLPHNYLTALLADYPDFFQLCTFTDRLTNRETVALELVAWRSELAVSEMERRVSGGDLRVKKGMPLRFKMSLPSGFDLEKKVLNWVDEFQCLPYVSPYENAFHLGAISDQAEKWAVAVLHELLWLLVSKKTEKANVFYLGDYFGFGDRFAKVLKHHPGIFYVSNKIRTQTIVLREAYRKDFLVEKHPLMGMRYRYIYLMNKVMRKKTRKPIVGSNLVLQRRREFAIDANK